MARVTVEDCIHLIPNRFELILLAAERAREITGGSAIHVSKDNDKNPVIALREIAESKVDLEELHQSIIKNLQKVSAPDEAEREILEVMAEEQAWVNVPESQEMQTEISEDNLEIESEKEISQQISSDFE